MPAAAPALDSVFQALANATRRAIVERLRQGPTTVSELARPFKMALPSFMQHLDVLEASGLIETHKQGRVRTVRSRAASLKCAHQWLAAQHAVWEDRLDRLDAHLKSMEK